MVLGNTKWTLDFLHYTLNGLFDLADEFEDVLKDHDAFTQKCRQTRHAFVTKQSRLTRCFLVVKTTTSLPLVIVLSSMSRAFLRFICRGLRGIYAGYATTVALTGDTRVYYTEICQTLDASSVRVDVYERFLAGVDSAVRHAYQAAAFGEAERPGPEKELIVNTRISPVLIPAVATILQQTIPALKPDIDRMAIYLGDYSWLGFGDDRRTELHRRTRDIDILKKLPLRKVVMPPGAAGSGSGNRNASTETPKPHSNPTPSATGTSTTTTTAQTQANRRRRCVRCCEVTVDTAFPRTILAFRMVLKLGLLRSCICGGMLAIEPGAGGSGSSSSQQNAGTGHAHPPPPPSVHHHSTGNSARTPGMVGGGLGASG